MDVGLIGFTLPLQAFLSFIYCSLTKRKMNFAYTYLLDFIIMICMIVWFYMYDYYLSAKNDGWGLQE